MTFADMRMPNSRKPLPGNVGISIQVARYPEAAQQLEASLKLHPENGDASALGRIYSKFIKNARVIIDVVGGSASISDGHRDMSCFLTPHL
jgi:hypothetical protein